MLACDINLYKNFYMKKRKKLIPKTKPYFIRIPSALSDELQKFAVTQWISANKVIIRILGEFFNKTK